MKSLARPVVAFLLEYPLTYGGGVSVLVRELLHALAARYALVLVSPDTDAEIEHTGVAPLLHARLTWEAAPATAERARILADWLVAHRVELAHFHMGGNLAWGNRTPWTCPFPLLRREGVRVVTTSHLVVSIAHGLLAPHTPWWKRQVKYAGSYVGKMRALLNQEYEIAVSRHDLRLLRRWYFPLWWKFRCIYHSRIHELSPGGARQPVILNVGHLALRKGQLPLVRAFIAIAARFPAWKLTLVGPPTEPEYAAQIAACVQAAGLSDRVQMLGQVDQAETLMRTAAVYVQPSLEEALGLALQEALFAGCACIGTRVGGIPELIDHERTGLLVEPGDEPALADALARLLSDESERARFGQAGADDLRRKGMTAENMAAQYAALYDEVLACPRPAS